MRVKHPLLHAALGAAALLLGGSLTSMPAGAADMKPDARPFTAHDLIMLDRLSDPRLAPDGSAAVYQQRRTDFAANHGVNSLWRVDLHDKTAPRALSPEGVNATSPRWAPDGQFVYFLADGDGHSQIWRVARGGGAAQQITHLPLDVNSFVLAPDGHALVLSLDVFPECPDLACTVQRLAARADSKASGQLYDKLFVRHWDTWADGTRAQLFTLALGPTGEAQGQPLWITRGIDGDVPSRPFGDDSEYSYAPDGKTVYFNVRIAGKTEAWSTNFDIYAVPADGSAAPKNLTADNPAWDGSPLAAPDGKTLYYLAQTRPGFESDRFGIMALDLASGQHREVAPHWDRSASALQISADGRTLYTAADELGQRKLFAIDVHSGEATALTDQGTVDAFSVAGKAVVYAQDSLKAPAQMFHARLRGHHMGSATRVTDVGGSQLAGLEFGDYEQFSFPGWNGETVHGYVIKPAGYEPGRKYPVAFLIHGGPQGSMGNHFHYRWNPETYAGAGFAAVMIDFHGSTGYGQNFTDSISGDWGGKPLEDLQKGWDYALRQYGFLDGSRACALGASYGGYMINWIAGNWSQPWKCLVVHDGVFDARMMAYSTEELWFSEWENGGTPYENPVNYEQFNPVNHVDAWRVPMLVVQGGKDYRIPLEQGLGAFTALQRRDIPSQFLYFPDENHWVLKPQNSLQWHQTVEAWLKRWTAE